MKKIIATMGVLSILATASAESVVTGSMTSGSSTNADKGVCAGVALDKRDSAIQSALDANTTAMKAALSSRTAGLKQLYLDGKAAGKNDARKKVWNDFSSSTKAAMTQMRNSRRAAWDTFQKDMATCGYKNHGEKLETVSVPVAF